MISIEDFETNKVYRHFKGNYYYVMDIAENTETNELMVIYHALYNDHLTYVRPFAIFVEELDNNFSQRHRFEPLEDNPLLK